VDEQRDLGRRAVELVSLTYFYERFRRRVEGLTDDEYLWEPVPGCLSIRAGDVGPVARGEKAVGDPLTTIAWRMCHIGDCLREERNWRWLGREPSLRDDDIRHPLTAAGGFAYVVASWARWQGLISSLSADEMWEPIGAVGGPYGNDERIGFVIHIMDELIHHAAEVGVMRDFYAAMGR
jgi:hypothetical protein